MFCCGEGLGSFGFTSAAGLAVQSTNLMCWNPYSKSFLLVYNCSLSEVNDDTKHLANSLENPQQCYVHIRASDRCAKTVSVLHGSRSDLWVNFSGPDHALRRNFAG